jgi:hypothetical protein
MRVTVQKDLDTFRGPVLYKTACETTQVEEMAMMMNWTSKQRNAKRYVNAATATCTFGLSLSALNLSQRPEQPAFIDNRQLRH